MSPRNGDRMLHTRTPDNVSLEMKDPVDPIALDQAKVIMAELRPTGGKVDAEMLMNVSKRLGDIKEEDTAVIITREACKAAFDGLSDVERMSLVNIHDRVKTFALAQRKAVTDMEIDIPGGKAGHTVSPCNGE
jgi:histidinol dehydrogenase